MQTQIDMFEIKYGVSPEAVLLPFGLPEPETDLKVLRYAGEKIYLAKLEEVNEEEDNTRTMG